MFILITMQEGSATYVFMHPPNYIDIELKKKKADGNMVHPPLPTVPLQDVTVWGGEMHNCGEDFMSKLAHDNRNSLRRFMYFPASYKGGMLARPHYWEGDRATGELFPLLRELGMPIADDPVPYLKLWHAPALESLVFLGDENRHTARANPVALRKLFPCLKTITFLRYDPAFVRLELTLEAKGEVMLLAK